MQTLKTSGLLTQAQIKTTGSAIAKTQKTCGAIPWYVGGKLDPWDHVEAAMGLSISGFTSEAEAAYVWLKKNQLADGSWHAQYFLNDANQKTARTSLKETNFIAYVATGVWHHYCINQDLKFLRRLFPCVQRAIDCVLHYQTPHGDIAWAYSNQGAEPDALLTACSSILRSLECAVRSARVLNEPYEHWEHAGNKLWKAITLKPFRFDRTWESKDRFAMDWYYPILAGVYNPNEMTLRLSKHWDTFVHQDLGCHCVSDEPWITVAESAELVIALEAAGQHGKALEIFENVQKWRTKDGNYWTGYVYRDDTLWPNEQTSWTAGAVLLAHDALTRHTAAHSVFLTPSAFQTT